ncbi:XdhC family protein [Nocardia carnea]|uniref:XdhC family protein n=1 Tax=Nocardia carnea TaxID=37328 RepID=A0ABW7THF3_9NOCA|nr:XdhC family protein [Nocardia carnea]
MRELAAQLAGWHAEGVEYALATVVDIRGSAPLPLGASMAVDAAGSVRGSLSGGCVEGAVYDLCIAVLASGVPARQSFGYSDSDAFAVGLTCGGELEVYVQRVTAAERPVLDAAWHAPGSAALVRDLVTGETVAVTPDSAIGSAGDPPDSTVDLARAMVLQGSCGIRTIGCGPAAREVFVESFAAPPRLIVFGANVFAGALARVGRLLGYHITLCEARPVFADRAGYPDVDDVVTEWPDRYLRTTEVDSRTVLCVLTHDPKFDIPVLVEALRLPVAYVGAMGSRRADTERRARLREAGVTTAGLARLHSPIGLELGGRTPEETAVAIGAEIVAHRHGGSARSLSATTRPIHVSVAAEWSGDQRIRSWGVSTSSGEPVSSHGTY